MNRDELMALVRYYYYEFVALNNTSRYIVDHAKWSDIMWLMYGDKNLQTWLSDLTATDTGDFLFYGAILSMSLD